MAISDPWQSKVVRHSVENDVRRYEGWLRIANLYQRFQAEQDVQMGVVCIFSTGGRIGEVLSLKRKNFQLFTGEQVPYVKVIDMPLEKRYLKTGSWTEERDELPDSVLRRLFTWNDEKKKWTRKRYNTKRVDATRKDFVIPFNEPMFPELVEYIKGFGEDEYLFPSRTRHEIPMTRNFIYTKLKPLGIYPHWLRAQRASCLRSYYHFTMDQIMDWFTWIDIKTAMRYAKMWAEEVLPLFRPVVY